MSSLGTEGFHSHPASFSKTIKPKNSHLEDTSSFSLLDDYSNDSNTVTIMETAKNQTKYSLYRSHKGGFTFPFTGLVDMVNLRTYLIKGQFELNQQTSPPWSCHFLGAS